MPIASPEVYADMIDRAKAGKYAYPAINVTSSSSINAAIQGFADAESDGLVVGSGLLVLMNAGVDSVEGGAVHVPKFRVRETYLCIEVGGGVWTN